MGRHSGDPVQRASRALKYAGPEGSAAARAGTFVEGNRVRRMSAAQRRAVPSHRAPSTAYTPREVRQGRDRDALPPVRRGRETRSGRGIPAPPHTGVLIAEWLFGVIAISAGVVLNGGDNGYGKSMQTVMYRLTGLTGIFFFLALLGSSSKAARFTVYFGALIDLGILYTASSASGGTSTMSKITDAFNGQSTMGGGAGALPAADVTNTAEPTPSAGLLTNVTGATGPTPGSSPNNAPVPA